MKRIFLIGNMAAVMINFREELIKRFAQENEVFCLANDYDAASKSKIHAFAATPVDYELNSQGINPLLDIIATIKLIKIIKEYQPDIVILFMVKPVIFGTIAAKLAGTKRIVGMIEGLGNAFTVRKRRRNPVQNTNHQIYPGSFI